MSFTSSIWKPSTGLAAVLAGAGPRVACVAGFNATGFDAACAACPGVGRAACVAAVGVLRLAIFSSLIPFTSGRGRDGSRTAVRPA